MRLRRASTLALSVAQSTRYTELKQQIRGTVQAEVARGMEAAPVL